MPTPLVLVTGANGQVGSELRDLATHWPNYRFLFTDRQELSLEHQPELEAGIKSIRPDWVINCAAYTAVDKAETEVDIAMTINGKAPGWIAAVCREIGAKLIHISTDYVFPGESTHPYREDDAVSPVNYYGATKLEGERTVLAALPDAIIVRTAWVYSAHGHNFVKTMLRLMKDRTELNVVDDQQGRPTYARDLAEALLQLMDRAEEIQQHPTPHLFHYSNTGAISWCTFAQAIAELSGSPCRVNPIPSSAYPTPAKRPAYSVMNTDKIREWLPAPIPHWKDSLHVCLAALDALPRK